MSEELQFLTLEEVIDIHKAEISTAGGLEGIRDRVLVEASVYAPQATFEGKYLMDLFEMAATYVQSIAGNHPFLDGNKRTALASGLTFLYLNGKSVAEDYPEQLAEKTLSLVNRDMSKDDFSKHLKEKSIDIV